MKKAALTTTLVLLLSVLSAASSVGQNAFRGWREDLLFLVGELEIRHANLYHTISREDFKQAVQEFESTFPTLNRDQWIIGLERLLAKIGDGHTGIFLPFNPSLTFRRLPLKLMPLRDGVVVVAAIPELAEWKGAKITRIGKHQLSVILSQLLPLLPGDNGIGPRARVASYLEIPEILRALGFVEDIDQIEITLENKEGRSQTIAVEPISRQQFLTLAWPEQEVSLPPWLRNSNQPFWMKHLEPKGILYVQLNSSDIGGSEEAFATFCNDIVATVEREKPDKLVVDLRRNRGGSLWRTYPLLYALIRADRVNQPGKLFTIIGSETFSAGSALATLIDLHTRSLFVGQPTGGKPNAYGDIGRFKLPHSGIQVRYSRLDMRQSSPWDTRPAIFPDMRAELTVEDYRENRDPSLEAIRAYQPKTQLFETLLGITRREGVDAALARYEFLRQNHYNEYSFTGNELNKLGYSLLREKRIEDAVKIFQFNVEQFPWSPALHDSLADGYFALGEDEKAMESLRKAFELNKYFTKWRDRANQNPNQQ